MFRYICIILGEFQSCTSLKLHAFYIIKILLKIIKLKYLCGCCWQNVVYMSYNIICISSVLHGCIYIWIFLCWCCLYAGVVSNSKECIWSTYFHSYVFLMHINIFSVDILILSVPSWTVLRKLQDFESPYISQKSIQGVHRVVLRKR